MVCPDDCPLRILIKAIIYYAREFITLPVKEEEEEKEVKEEEKEVKEFKTISSVVDVEDWKLTLPFGSEIKDPKVIADLKNKYFYLTDKGLVMNAPCNATTTKNSKYPRCEFREWTKKDIFWSAKGTHALKYRAACTHLPKNKPEIVCGQVHDLEDDVFEIKFSGTDIIVFHDSTVYGKLLTGYKLGEFITFSIDITDGDVIISATRDDSSIQKLSFKMVSIENCYFKVGAYVQSNASKGDGDDYGEIILEYADIIHKP